MARMTITVGIMGDDLGDLTGCDEQASYERYAELIEEALIGRFPAAAIDVRLDTGLVGARPWGMQTRVTADDDEQERATIEVVAAITDRIHQAGEWVVEA